MNEKGICVEGDYFGLGKPRTVADRVAIHGYFPA